MSKRDDRSNKGAVPSEEIESLNVDDLDIEELERRIELASAMPIVPDAWICGTDGCGTDSSCGSHCGSDGGGGCTSDGGGGCFMAGTMIRMADGTYVPIEQLTVGDRVLSYSTRTGEVDEGVVVKSFVHERKDGYFVINGTLRATATHPFFANGGWVRTSDLKVGDALLVEDREASGADGEKVRVDRVRSLDWVPGENTVYNFAVSRRRNYFAEGVLVHNKITPV